MQEREFHIINVGASIITNYQKIKEDFKNIKLSDNFFWQNILDNPILMNDIYEFIKKEPKKNSAELNTFLRKIENTENFIEVYFVGTKTPVNEICVRILERYIKDLGFSVYISKEFHGYFLEISKGEDRAKEFVKDALNMLDHLIRLAQMKKKEGYKVLFNPTGGFKAHVIICALAGFITQSVVYYLNEEFQEVITFPPLFYLPKPKEIELLKILLEKKSISIYEFEKLTENFKEEIERLELYGLIESELDQHENVYKIRLKNLTQFILKDAKN